MAENEFFLLNNKIDEVIKSFDEFKMVIGKELEEIKEKIIRETTIEIKSNGNYIVKDRVKFFSDLYIEIENLKKLKSIPKFMNYFLTILLIMNLIITLISKL